MDHPHVTCERFREELPVILAAGDEPTGALARHRDGCQACRGEEEILRQLLLLRPEPPAALSANISAALHRPSGTGETESGVPLRGGWGRPVRVLLPAAALLVATLGTILLRGGEGIPAAGDGAAAVVMVEGIPGGLEGAHLWPSGNGMVAGEPLLLLDGLSEEQLEALLEEMEG